MTNTELLDLLREARVSVFHDHEYARIFGTETDPAVAAVPKLADLLARIDAALAERQDSATDVVESEPVDWGAPDRFQIAHVGSFVAEVFPDRDGKGWVWAIARRDNANTEAEAKSAAIAAAKGLR